MRKIEIYCQQEFLDIFIKKMKEFSLVDLDSSSIGYLYDLYLLLFVNSQTIIYSDLTNEEISKHGNPYIKSLYKKQKIESRTDEFAKILEESTQKNYFEKIGRKTRFFFLNLQPNLAERLEEKFGYIVISKNKIETIQKYFIFHRTSISNIHTSSWDFVRNYRHPCNAIIITDDYLVKNGQDIKNNIVPILRRIMPAKLDIDFHLTIFGFSKLTSEKFDEVKLELENSFINTKYQVSLCIIPYNYHDRFLLTNYYHFSCGQGFNMIENKNVKGYY